MELIHGDCLEEMRYIDFGNTVIITDPPFNIGYKYNTYKDNMKDDDYFNMLKNIFSFSPFVLIHYPEYIYRLAIEIKTPPIKVVSWVYNSNTAKQHRDIAFFGVKPDFRKCPQPYKNPNDKRIAKRILEGKSARLYDWWKVNQVKNVSKEKTNHPCQMPVEVMYKIIKILPSNLIVLDPFMGSGTTGVACKNLNRDFIGIEKDETYFKIAEERINNHEKQRF